MTLLRPLAIGLILVASLWVALTYVAVAVAQ